MFSLLVRVESPSNTSDHTPSVKRLTLHDPLTLCNKNNPVPKSLLSCELDLYPLILLKHPSITPFPLDKAS